MLGSQLVGSGSAWHEVMFQTCSWQSTHSLQAIIHLVLGKLAFMLQDLIMETHSTASWLSVH